MNKKIDYKLQALKYKKIVDNQIIINYFFVPEAGLEPA